MNTPAARVNLTIPKDILDYLKNHTDNMSRYISEAVRERIARERRARAVQEILSAKPAFTDVTDGKSYVRRLREEDTKRDKRLRML
jgi:hypothetical protein